MTPRDPPPPDSTPGELDAWLDRLIDLSAAERREILDRECDDAELRARIERVLAAEAPGPLDEGLAGVAPGLIERLAGRGDTPYAPGASIGGYRLIRELGRGGMGAVFLADREEGDFRRTVAVKVVRGGPDAESLARRFLQERRILALLEHPRIARMYEGGITEQGDHYVVMEYVDGRAIDDYCDEEQLSIEDRVRLFDQVCEAVEYAHRRLIVHRDLKPNNILVEASGDVKLLDFGIAKLLDASSDDGVTLTGVVRPALTPEYASPEQLRGEPISTACDVYALGVLLYELLTGVRPYTFSSRSPIEIERTIRDEDPPKPSAAVGGATAESGSTPRRGGPDARRLRDRLAGDLDNIVLMAMSAEPDRRYPSVAALRDDLARHLGGFPVSARAQTLGYRAGRFVRRHRGAVAAVAVGLAATLAGVTGTVWQARAAERQAVRAERVAATLAGVFQASDPDEAAGRELTAREVLDRGAERVESELAGEPEVQAELFQILGDIYRSLGEFEAGRGHLERSVELRRGLGRSAELDLAESLASLSSVLYRLSDLEAAEAAARESLEIRRRRLGPEAPGTVRSVANVASVLSTGGNYDEAEPLLREVLALDRAAGDSAEVATDLSNLGLLLQQTNRNDESLTLLEEAVALRRALHGDEHTLVSIALLNLAETLKALGEFERADTLLGEVIQMRVRLLGDEHPDVALAINNRASLMSDAGRYDEAAALHRRALAIRRAALGPEHPDVAGSLNNLAVVAYFQGELDDAASAFVEAREVFARALGETHPNTLSALNNLASVYRQQGRLTEAEQIFLEGLELQRDAYGPEHPGAIRALHNLAWTLFDMERFDEAVEHFASAAALFQETQGRHPNTGTALGGLGRAHLELGDPAQAEGPLREAVAILAESLDPGSTRTADLRIWLGVCLTRLDRAAEAAEHLTTGLEASRAAEREPDHPMTLRAEEALRRISG